MKHTISYGTLGLPVSIWESQSVSLKSIFLNHSQMIMNLNLKFVDRRHFGKLQNRNELPYKNLYIHVCVYMYLYLEHSVLLFASFTLGISCYYLDGN